MTPRFKALKVETEGGRQIVTLHDFVEDQSFTVYKRGSRWLRWSNDLAVTNRAAQRVAREAMENGVQSSQMTVEDCIAEAGFAA